MSVYVYTHTCIDVVVVFGILMEFVLYATVIAGTTPPTSTSTIFQTVRAFDDDDDGDHYVFFILCP